MAESLEATAFLHCFVFKDAPTWYYDLSWTDNFKPTPQHLLIRFREGQFCMTC